MTEISKTSFDFIKGANQKLKGKFLKAFIATLIVFAPLMLLCFTLYAAPVAILLFGVLETGYIRYMRGLINNENPSYKMLFSEFTNPGLEMFLGAIMICMFVVGTVILIVPGIILISFYSMSLYFAEYNKAKTVGEAMGTSAVKMNGNVISMLAYKAIYWLFYVIVILLGLFGCCWAYKLWATSVGLSILVICCTFVVVTLLWSLITVYYHTSTELFFQELLLLNNKPATTEKKVDTIKEEKVEEAKKEEKPSEVKKTTTRKPTTKKETTTTKKSTTRKTTTKK